MNRNRILIIAAVIVVVLGFVATTLIVLPPPPRVTDIISLRDVSLCAGSNCIYADPSLSGIMLVNGSVPLATLHLFINGTDEGIITGPNATTTYATALHPSFAFVFRTQPNNPSMPIMAEKTYAVMVEARFQDNSAESVSVMVVAISGQSQVTFTVVLSSDPTQGCITIARTSANCLYNGTTEVQWSPGDYELAAYPNLNHLFVSWNASGGVFVTNPTSDITTVMVMGPGTLQANFIPMTTSSLQPQTIQPTTIRNQDLKYSDAKVELLSRESSS